MGNAGGSGPGFASGSGGFSGSQSSFQGPTLGCDTRTRTEIDIPNGRGSRETEKKDCGRSDCKESGRYDPDSRR